MIKSTNEWGQLKRCVVGSATGANFPRLDYFFHKHKQISKWSQTEMPLGKIDPDVVNEANEDLESLCNTLRELSIEVLRPLDCDFTVINETSHWKSDGYMNYCPRDVLLIIDDIVIECPMSLRSRTAEHRLYSHIKKAHTENNGTWISAPVPDLLESDIDIVDNKIVLSERQPIFDAANVLRFDNDLLYLVSSSANKKGAEWLSTALGEKYQIHVLDNLYASTHIDTTIVPIKPGLVLLNGSRVNENNCPAFFDSWKKIYIEDLEEIGFYQYPYASKWISMNMLSISPDLVICDKHQAKLIRILERHKIEVIPMELRHARTLGGGFHCVTLDLYRV